jgi:hypothetical protein
MSEYIPEGATHKWKGAGDNPPIGVRVYYAFEDGKWWSYSRLLACWCPTGNPDSWFEEEMRQGYFVEIS